MKENEMSDEIRMTLLHHSTNDLIEELLMWKGLAAEHLDRIAELEALVERLIEAGDAMINAHSMWGAEEDKWDALVTDWEEREG